MRATAEKLSTPIGGVPTEHVAYIWPRVEPILARVVTPETGYNLSHVLASLQNSSMQLMVVGNFEAAVITSFIDKPLHRVLWVDYLAGTDMREWAQELVAALHDYAQQHGCKYAEFSGRAGWRSYESELPAFKRGLTNYRMQING